MVRDERDRPVGDARAAIVALEETTLIYERAINRHTLAVGNEAAAKNVWNRAIGDEMVREECRINGKNPETREGQMRALFPDLAEAVAEASATVIATKGQLDVAKMQYEAQMRLVSAHRSILAYLGGAGVE